MDVGETLRVATAAGWRKWLRRHHASKREVWLVYHAKGTRKRSIPYGDAVDEALCFGWIDSVVKKLPGEEGARAQRFTPRRKGSPVSEVNKARVRRLVAEGRMTPAGLAAMAHHKDLLEPPRVRLAADVRSALREDPLVWKNYRAFPEEYRRIRIGWIEGARSRPEVFEQRLRHFVRMTRQGKQYGMVRG